MAVRIQEAATLRLNEMYRCTRDRWDEAQAEIHHRLVCHVRKDRNTQCCV